MSEIVKAPAAPLGVRILRTLFLLTAGLLLLALLVPINPGCGTNSSHAENTAYQLRNAISAYYTEYRIYPVPNSDGDTTIDTGHPLMDTLLGADHAAEATPGNPRRIVFYSARRAKPAGSGRFRKGLTMDAQGGGQLWDSWGNRYRVRLDTDLDNRVANPEPSGTGSAWVPEGILVWSAGEDGNFDTWKDNVKTW